MSSYNRAIAFSQYKNHCKSFTVEEKPDFQTADSMEIPVANNAFGKRDLGNRENLGQGANIIQENYNS